MKWWLVVRRRWRGWCVCICVDVVAGWWKELFIVRVIGDVGQTVRGGRPVLVTQAVVGKVRDCFCDRTEERWARYPAHR